MHSARVDLISDKNLATVIGLFRALAHPLRLQLLEFIGQHKATNVNKIYNTLKLEQSVTSQHLRILRDTGLVLTTRKGKFIYYSINYPLLSKIEKGLGDFFDS